MPSITGAAPRGRGVSDSCNRRWRCPGRYRSPRLRDRARAAGCTHWRDGENASTIRPPFPQGRDRSVSDLARFALITFTSILFIVDPVAAVPTYLVITRDETPAGRRRTALRACLAMTVLLMVFAATGTAIFRAFGITLPAFRTAGGLILW